MPKSVFILQNWKFNIHSVLLFSLVGLIFLSGCSSGFKQRWTNFRSYYNTFFNANQSYERGFRVQIEQQRDINPEIPVRIHPKAVRAAAKEFQNAIDKSADLLRKYPDSKWSDDAVFLIGRSYFFQQELFSALEKFTELYRLSESRNLKQQAIYWRGRSLLDLKSYAQAKEYLNPLISDTDIDWIDTWKAETQAVLAQVHVEEEEYDLAVSTLEPALGKLQRNDENAYAYFLYGQLLERINQPEEALKAYRRVPRFNPEYNVIYHARRKEAEIARNQGYFEDALKLFTRMARDDKNFDIMGELNYEIARTQLEMGNFQRAEELYYDLLYRSIQDIDKETKAKAYNDLGEVFREGYLDLFMAQAYYDSSAAMRPDPLLMPESYKAPELAENLGTYVKLKLELIDQDSLLRLGRLPKEEFDSVLVVIREQKRKEFEELEKERRKQENTLVNLSAGPTNTNSSNQGGGTAGFLNNRNSQLMQENSRRFKAIWGNRPLVPMWRRIEAVRNQQLSDQAQQDSSLAETAVQDPALEGFNLDLSAIPFTEEAQLEVERQIAIRSYQLGNLFYLQLNEADSALYYFEQVIQFKDSLDVRPQAYYAGIEILNEFGNQVLASKYFQELLQSEPTSIYAKRAAEILDKVDQLPEEAFMSKDSRKDSVAIAYEALLEEWPTQSVGFEYLENRADEFVDFALNHRKATYGALAYEQALRPLIDSAKVDLTYQQKLKRLFQKQDSVQSTKRAFKEYKDSLKTVLSDTTIQLEKVVRDSLQTIADSTLASFDYEPYFPYLGAKWNAVRSRLSFADSMEVLVPSKNFWVNLSKVLKLPEQFVEEIQIVADTTQFYDCEDAEWLPKPLVTPEAFMKDSLIIPEQIAGAKLFSEVIFEIKTDTAGKVVDAALKTELSGTGIEQVMAEQLLTKFSIEPVIFENKKIQTICRYTFPASLTGIEPKAKEEELKPQPADSSGNEQ